MTASVIETNKATIRELFQAWGDSRWGRVRELVDPDGEWWTLANRRTRSGRDHIERIKALNEETLGGTMDFRVGPLTAEDDRVAAVVESLAEFGDQGEYRNLYHFLFRLTDGRVTQAWLYYDTALSNRVLRGEGGATPPLVSHAND